MFKQQLNQTTRSFSTKNFNLIKQDPITIQQLLTQYSPELITSQFRNKFKKDLQTYLFKFDVKYQQKQWKIYKKLDDFLIFQHKMKKKYKRQVPAIPVRKQVEINKSNIKQLSQLFQFFIRKSINLGFYDEEVQDFLHFLPESLGNGIIYGYATLKKHSGGRYTQATCSKKIQGLFCCCRNWRRRFFTVTDQGVFYTLSKQHTQIKQMLNFSSNFTVFCGFSQTGNELGIQIKSAYRVLQLKADNLYDFVLFTCAIKNSFKQSPHKNIHRFKSFSSIKENCSTKYYIDGQFYFEDIRNCLLSAKKNVYITDWMLTPYFLLKRPSQLDDRSSRLDYILQTIANRGVKVYIILYMEPKIALNNDSQFVEKHLEKMNKNIKVLRHPNFILIPFLWSHHQKMVIIDQAVAFMGGLDLCYGRWDNQKHQLNDSQSYWKGADFCNFRISDIYSPRNFLVSNINKKNQPRMPWHDITVQIKGSSVHDLTRHFIQYWNFVNFQTRFNERQLLMHSGRHSLYIQTPKPKNSSLILEPLRYILGHVKKDQKMSQNKQINLNQRLQVSKGKDEVMKQIKKKQETQGQRQFYDHYLNESRKITLPSIEVPKIQDIKNYPKRILELIKDGQDGFGEERLLISHEQNISQYGNYNHQILRSASTWSLGLQENFQQKSIYYAYLDLIQNAKHFIYIENQFFISKENKICKALVDRIKKAHLKKEQFKVIILMPLLPGFEGDILNQSSSSVMRVQLFWEYQTLSRSPNSLYKSLSHIQNIEDYLKVLSVRQHGVTVDNIPVTQILYIHSKLIIVDDERVLLGSANINDRSLLGDRDSQIGIIIQDSQLKKDEKVDRFYSQSARNLRIQLYKQHFQLTSEQSSDFLNQATWKQIKIRAKINTEVYREVFGCYPDDTMSKIQDVQKVRKQAQLEKYKEMKKYIKGHVVEFPHNFLNKQNLNLKISQREYFIPQINFT